MNEKLPSKQFMIRGGIIGLVVIGIVFAVLYTPNREGESLSQRLRVANNTETVGDAVRRDTDGDGVPDWEERLLDLDPNNPDTFGTGEGDLAAAERLRAERRENIDVELLENADGSMNETDALTRDLYIAVNSLMEGGELDDNIRENLTAFTAGYLGETGLAEPYTEGDISAVANTAPNQQSYLMAYERLVASYQPETHPVAVINQLEASEDPEILKQLEEPVQQHRQLRDSLLGLDVPRDAVSYHLDIVNALNNVVSSIEHMQLYFEDPLLAMIGVLTYYDYMAQFATSIETFNTEYYQSITNEVY